MVASLRYQLFSGGIVDETVALIASGATTVNVTVLLVPAAVVTITETEPNGTPLGTVATMLVLLQVAFAAIPPKVIVLVPCVVPKLKPVIVTAVPTEPADGERLVIVGTGEGRTSTALKL